MEATRIVGVVTIEWYQTYGLLVVY
jgi:hypothetical protein